MPICLACGTAHPTLDADAREGMRQLGYTPLQIDQMAHELASLAVLPVDPDTSRTRSLAALRQQRYRARQKSLQTNAPTPRWAAKKLI